MSGGNGREVLIFVPVMLIGILAVVEVMCFGGCASLDTQIRTLGDVTTRQEQAVAKIEQLAANVEVVGANVAIGTGALLEARDSFKAVTTQTASQEAGHDAVATQVGGWFNTVGGNGMGTQTVLAALTSIVAILWWRARRERNKTRADAAVALGRHFR